MKLLARLLARFRRPADTRVYKLDDPEQDGPPWVPTPWPATQEEADRLIAWLKEPDTETGRP